MCVEGKQRYEPDYTIAEEILGAGVLCVWGKNVCLCGCVGGECVVVCGGERLFIHRKRLLYPTNYWAEVPGRGGKTPPI